MSRGGAEDVSGHDQTTIGPPDLPADRNSLSRRAVEVLRRLVGEKESPPRSNRGKVIDQIVIGLHGDGEWLLGQPWCGRAVRYAFEKAAQELGLPPPFGKVKRSLAGVVQWREIFSKWAVAEPRPGVVGILGDADDPDKHITLVSGLLGRCIWSVEGNHHDAIAEVMRVKSEYALFLDVERAVRELAGS